MKNNFLLPIFLVLSLLFTTSITHAGVVVWRGGDASWNDPNEWDTGVVPTDTDEVYILRGTAHVAPEENAEALNIVIQDGGALYVHKGANLTVFGEDDRVGIYNDKSTIIIAGFILVDRIESPNGSNAKGIYSTGTITIEPTGGLNLQFIEDTSLDNRGTFDNYGSINIVRAESYGIFNTATFLNKGEIYMSGYTGNTRYGIYNSNYFSVESGAEVSINNNFRNGIHNTSQGTIENSGEIGCYTMANTGFSNRGFISNKGTIELGFNTPQGLYNTGEFYNGDIGYLVIERTTNTGIYNSSLITNYGRTSILSDNNGTMGIYLTNSGIIDNQNFLALEGNYALHGIFLRGEVYNAPRAILSFLSKVSVAGGKIENEGFLSSKYDGNHTIYGGGKITNFGIIDDNYNSFPSTLNNQQVIVKPVTGTMQVGVPYPNVLDIVDLSNVDNIATNWKIARSGPASAGTYDLATNTFTPSAAAEGLTVLYLGIEQDGLSRNHTIEIPGGVVAAGSPHQQQDQEIEIANGFSTFNQDDRTVLSVFPNPTKGNLQIQSQLFEQAPTDIRVFNTLGQLVHEIQNTAENFTQQLALPEHLSSGMYTIQVIQNDKSVAAKRIQLQR